MKKFTLLSVFMLASFALFAQYVPAKYQFSKLPLGAYAIDACLNAVSNPVVSYQPAIDAADGFSAFSGGQMGATQTANIAAFRSALSIVDMSSVGQGKVLVFKGKNSTVSEGVAASGLIPGYLVFHFYGNNNFPTEKRMRASFTFGMSTTVPAADALLKLGLTSLQLGDITTGKLLESSFNSLDYNNSWFTVTTDVTAKAADPAVYVPIRIKLSIAANKIDNAAIYIKDFSLTPVNDLTTKDTYEITNITAMQHIAVGIHEIADIKFNAFASEGKINVNGLTSGNSVRIFNMAGSKVYETIAQSGSLSLNLHKGLYIINVDGQSVKVAL